MITLQLTLFNTTGKYRPISTTVNVVNIDYYKQHTIEVQTHAIKKICAQRYVNWEWMKENGYTCMKVRLYNKGIITPQESESL